jgi:hypothetical protein
MADIVPHNFIRALANKEIEFDADILHVALFNSSYTPNADDTTYNTISANEVANGFGYTTSGVSVSGTLTNSNANNNVVFDINDPTWTASGGSIGPARYATLFDVSSSNTLCYIFDLSASQTASDGATFKIVIDSNGLMTAQQS